MRRKYVRAIRFGIEDARTDATRGPCPRDVGSYTTKTEHLYRAAYWREWARHH